MSVFHPYKILFKQNLLVFAFVTISYNSPNKIYIFYHPSKCMYKCIFKILSSLVTRELLRFISKKNTPTVLKATNEKKEVRIFLFHFFLLLHIFWVERGNFLGAKDLTLEFRSSFFLFFKVE